MKTLLFLLSFLAANLNAASVTFQWDPPAGMPAGTTYILSWGTTSGAYQMNYNAGAASTATITNLFFGTNYVVAFTRATNGVQSEPSNELIFVNKPPAPGNLRIPVQGAGSPSGPWTNIAEFTVPIELTNNPSGFFRALAVIERP